MSTTGTKVKLIWKGFLTDTSMHGCHYLTQGNKHVVSRVFWFLLVISFLTLLIINLQSLYNDYKQYNYRSKTNIKFNDNLEFPAISMCNSHSFDKNKLNKSSDLYQYLYGTYTMSLSNPNYFSDPKWNRTVVAPWALETVVFNASDTFLYAYHGIGNRNINPSRFQINYKWPVHTCFTYNGQWKQKDFNRRISNEEDGLVMYVNINQDRYAFESYTAGMHLCIHPADEPLDTRTPCTVLSPGHAYEVKLKVHEYTYLPYPYNSYQSSDCITSHSGLRNLNYFHRYSYRGCLLECVTDMVLKACGCITEFEVQNASNHYCSVIQRECAISVRKKFHFDTAYASNANKVCVCPRPCSHVVYDQDMSASIFPASSFMGFLKAYNIPLSFEQARSNSMRIHISFKTSIVTYINHIPELTLADILSIMGGLMGFYIGASVLTVLEVLDVVLRTLTTIIASRLKVETVCNKTKPTVNQTVVLPSVD